MCGIAGYLRPAPAPQTEASDCAILRQMAKTLHHRGPDGSGIYRDDLCGLAHTRLAILDLSDHGAQPMSDATGHLQIVYNGEIYNLAKLRNDLKSRGVVFRGHSDTEVLIEAYRIYGEDVVNHLNGMFAFAIWDTVREKLFLARDRAGQKPLVYAHVDGVFIFASEIKALLDWPDFKPEPNWQAVHHYMTLQYVPSPLSAFSGVHKFPPGHSVKLSCGQVTKPKPYWRLPVTQQTDMSREDLKAQTMLLLENAVKYRLRADMPVGAFLSGGVDSSAITAMMARHVTSSFKTFSLGFDEPGFDERTEARQVARHCGSEHFETIMRPEDITTLAPVLARQYDEPFGDMSAFPTYCISRLARQHVSVVLNGDGGDELFLGYERYMRAGKEGWIDNIPSPLRAMCARMAATPKGLDRFRPTRIARRWAARMAAQGAERYMPDIGYFFGHEQHAAYGPLLRQYLSSPSSELLQPYFSAKDTQIEGASFADFHTYLPDDLMAKVDIASMAHGLEARSPFLDVNLIEWAFSLSHKDKVYNGQSKALLKEALEPYLPKPILYRQKMGFAIPIETWLRGPLRDFANDMLTSRSARESGLYNNQYIETMLHEHQNNTKLHHTHIWSIIMLEQWRQSFKL